MIPTFITFLAIALHLMQVEDAIDFASEVGDQLGRVHEIVRMQGFRSTTQCYQRAVFALRLQLFEIGRA